GAGRVTPACTRNPVRRTPRSGPTASAGTSRARGRSPSPVRGRGPRAAVGAWLRLAAHPREPAIRCADLVERRQVAGAPPHQVERRHAGAIDDRADEVLAGVVLADLLL